MSHGGRDADGNAGGRDDALAKPARALPLPLAAIDRLMRLINRGLFFACSLAVIAAALVQTEAVLARNFLGDSSEWQEEVTVFLLLGGMFLSMASVQARRGHIGIDALDGILPASINRVRVHLVDVASLAFTAFFAWKCCQLLQEAIVDDEHTMSTWGPPLWIPYSLMASGMVLLTVQVLLQTIVGFVSPSAGLITSASSGAALPGKTRLPPETHR